LPREDLNAEKYHAQAKVFWQDDMSRFRAGELTYLTQRDDPLFIPVEVRPRGDDRPIKFAFLEGDGEWYRLNQVDARNRENFEPLPQLKRPIEQVLSSYVGGVSIIFVCPAFEANPAKPVNLSRASLAAQYQPDRQLVVDDIDVGRRSWTGGSAQSFL
jgi:hypothetical protein